MTRNCTPKNKRAPSSQSGKGDKVSLPVLAGGSRDKAQNTGKQLRPGATRTARWRAFALLGINLLIVAHILQWALMGRTLSPVEPSESKFFIERGELNAGAIFFAAALLSTLLFGRFFCGWACHIVALQDLCSWLLTKMRIRPHAFRSRFLFHAPFALAIYMFVWPAVYRWWLGIPPPAMSDHLMTANFWETFPGPVITIVTLLVCGFLIVYALGQKAFCTYGCPYGGFFAPLDKASPARIRVTDACAHCGHCTAVCTSNVRVHEEVAAFGAVVDPGCMKCMDCVETCPNDALYYGLGKPAFNTKPRRDPKPVTYDFTLVEEFLVLGSGLLSLFIFRGLFTIPLLLTMGLAAVIGFWFVKLIHVIRKSHVKIQNLHLKRAGSITTAGIGYVIISAMITAFLIHSAIVKYHISLGEKYAERATLGDAIWWPDGNWWGQADDQQRSAVANAISHYETSLDWALFPSVSPLESLPLLYLARGDKQAAQQTAQRLATLVPYKTVAHVKLGSVLRAVGSDDEAATAFLRALELNPCQNFARRRLLAIYESQGRFDEAMSLFHDEALKHAECHEQLAMQEAEFLQRNGRFQDAITLLRQYVETHPQSVAGHYRLGAFLLSQPAPDIAGAALQFESTIALAPEFADAHYNLAVARYHARRFAEARDSVKRAIELDSADPQKYMFLAAVLQELGDFAGARKAQADAQQAAAALQTNNPTGAPDS